MSSEARKLIEDGLFPRNFQQKKMFCESIQTAPKSYTENRYSTFSTLGNDKCILNTLPLPRDWYGRKQNKYPNEWKNDQNT